MQHASDVVGMEDSPTVVLRGKADASIRVAFELVKNGEASAVVSPGNTGAVMASGVFISGTLPGIATTSDCHFDSENWRSHSYGTPG